jgi:hypothetical protein
MNTAQKYLEVKIMSNAIYTGLLDLLGREEQSRIECGARSAGKHYYGKMRAGVKSARRAS